MPICDTGRDGSKNGDREGRLLGVQPGGVAERAASGVRERQFALSMLYV
jgi:hypothetical protein